MSDPAAPSRRHRVHAIVATLLLSIGLSAITAGVAAVVAIAPGCVTTDAPAEEEIVTEPDLTPAQEVQNTVSLPFRAVGGAVMFPLEFVFATIPQAIGDAFTTDIGALLDELEEAAPGDRERLLHMLADITDAQNEEVVAVFVAHLREDASPYCRRESALALRRLAAGGESVTTALAEHARRDPDLGVRGACVYALGQAGDRATVLPAIRDVWRDTRESEVVRSFALLALGERGDESIRPDCHAILTESRLHPLWHANTVLALAHLGGDEARPAVLAMLSHKDDRVVIAAVTALGILKETDLLVSLCRAGTGTQRTHALIALGEYGGLRYVGVLSRFRRSANRAIATHATFGLAAAGWRPVVPHLIELLLDPDPWVRLWSLTWLMRLTGETHGLAPKDWRRWWESEGDEFLNNAPVAEPADPR